LPVSVQEAKQIITGAAARPTQMISSARGAGEGSRRGARRGCEQPTVARFPINQV